MEFLAPLRPIFFPQRTIYLPENSEGVSYRLHPAHPRTLPQLSATVPRMAIGEVLCPGVLPWPCPGQVGHQWTLTGREKDVLGVALGDCFTGQSGPSLVVESGNWTAVVSYFLPFRLSLLEV